MQFVTRVINVSSLDGQKLAPGMAAFMRSFIRLFMLNVQFVGPWIVHPTIEEHIFVLDSAPYAEHSAESLMTLFHEFVKSKFLNIASKIGIVDTEQAPSLT